MFRAGALAFLALISCSRPRQIAVQVKVPDLQGVPTPLPGLVVTALPYDRDSVIAALEQRASAGRPHTRALDSLFQAFRAPFVAFTRAAWQAEQGRRRRDSLTALRGAAAAGSAGARELDRRIAALEDSLQLFGPELSRTRQALSAARDTLWPRIRQLQEDVRRWELSTYAGYDSIVRGLVQERLRIGFADTTDATGWVELRLDSRSWWVYARSPDPLDPNAEWYWNLPAAADTLRFDPTTGRHLPRY